MRKIPISIHPLFILFLFVSLISGLGLFALSLLTAVIIHESSHALIAHHYGVKTKCLKLLPFGAQIEMDIAFMPKNQKILILLAGSFGNIIFALTLGALMWTFPSMFMVWESLILTNASIAILNLLPIYPLDGGKILHTLFGKSARKTSQIISTLFFITLLFFSILISFNSSLIIMSVTMLLMINLEFGQSELTSRFKSHTSNSQIHSVAITSNTTLFATYKLISPRYFTQFIISDKSNKILYENQLEDLLISHPYDTPIQNVIQ